MPKQSSMFSMSTPPGRLNPRSVLDSFVLSLQPIIKKKTVKIQGVKYKQTIREIRSNIESFSLKEVTIKQQEELLKEIEMPTWFNKKEYLDNVWNGYQEYLAEHAKLKNNIDKLLKQKEVYTKSNLGLVRDILDELYDNISDTSQEWYTKDMAEFLESDLPYELYDMYNQSFVCRLNLLDTIRSKWTALQTNLYLHRSDDMRFTRDVNRFKSTMKSIVQSRLNLSNSESLIRLYVKINNASNMNELSTIIPLTIKKSDKEKFSKYFSIFEKDLKTFQDILSQILPTDKPSNMSYPESKALSEFEMM